jgi:hypothetical protein
VPAIDRMEQFRAAEVRCRQRVGISQLDVSGSSQFRSSTIAGNSSFTIEARRNKLQRYAGRKETKYL